MLIRWRRVVAAVVGVVVMVSVVFMVSLAGSGSEPSAGEIGDSFVVTGAIIETPDHGPMVVATILFDSLPPQGGDVRLTGWDWAQAEALAEVKQLQGTRWTREPLTVEGTWDGSALAVDSVTAATERPRPVETPRTCNYPADLSSLSQTPGVIGWSTEEARGSCELTVLAVGPSSSVDATVSTLGEDIEVEYLLMPVE